MKEQRRIKTEKVCWKIAYHIRDTDLKPVCPDRDGNISRAHPRLRGEFDVVGGVVDAAYRVDLFPLVCRIRLIHVVVQWVRCDHCQAYDSYQHHTFQKVRHSDSGENDCCRANAASQRLRENGEKRNTLCRTCASFCQLPAI